jgi:hypothetical protein
MSAALETLCFWFCGSTLIGGMLLFVLLLTRNKKGQSRIAQQPLKENDPKFYKLYYSDLADGDDTLADNLAHYATGDPANDTKWFENHAEECAKERAQAVTDRRNGVINGITSDAWNRRINLD